MPLPKRRNIVSQRASLSFVVFVALLAFACITGCGDHHHATNEIAVADSFNSRVLLYKTPLSNGQGANVVLGQPDFVSSGAALSATGMDTPADIAEDSHGDIFVSDLNNSRVLEFKPPFTAGMAASVVIGQPDFITNTPNTTQDGLNQAGGMTIDGSGNLWVSDFGNNRVLEYKPPFVTGMSASLVIGQPDFVSNGAATTDSGLAGPHYPAFDGSGNLWVTDTQNNRVLEFKPPFANGMAASLVIGQADFVSSGAATSDTGLSFPTGIAFNRGNLWIGDTANNRVLEFKPPFSTGMAASLVLGQADFVSNGANTTQNGLSGPFGIAFDSRGNLGVADPGNNRSLVFDAPFSTNQNASVVLGQPDFVSNTPATTQTGESSPFSIKALF